MFKRKQDPKDALHLFLLKLIAKRVPAKWGGWNYSFRLPKSGHIVTRSSYVTHRTEST
jgi:hypothetical protein